MPVTCVRTDSIRSCSLAPPARAFNSMANSSSSSPSEVWLPAELELSSVSLSDASPIKHAHSRPAHGPSPKNPRFFHPRPITRSNTAYTHLPPTPYLHPIL